VAAEVFSSRCAILLMDPAATTHGLSLLDELSGQAAQVKVVLFGMDEDPELFFRTVHLGVSGFVLKEASASEIVAAVLSVARGEGPPALPGSAWLWFASQEYRMGAKLRIPPKNVKYSLTQRQLQLMDLVEQGMTNKEIAGHLNLSEFTIKNHLRRIMRQVEADDRHEAVDVIRASGIRHVA
jgi:two-component system, NarL family, response regulator DegU